MKIGIKYHAALIIMLRSIDKFRQKYCGVVQPLKAWYQLGLKYSKAALLSIPIASYWSIKRLPLNYFSCAQQDHKINGIGIINIYVLYS